MISRAVGDGSAAADAVIDATRSAATRPVITEGRPSTADDRTADDIAGPPQTTPNANIASATFLKPAMFAPFT